MSSSPADHRPGTSSDGGRRSCRYFTAAELVETLYRGLADNSVGKVIEKLLQERADHLR